jgi:asparagine synthase (glutamine-hydrolysing)
VSHGFDHLLDLIARKQWTSFAAEAASVARRVQKPAIAVLRQVGVPQMAEHARRAQWMDFAKGATAIGRAAGWLTAVRSIRFAFQHLRHQPASSSSPGVDPWNLLRSDIKDRTAIGDFVRDTSAARAAALPGARRLHAEGLGLSLYQSALETAAKAAGGFGIDARYPFFDRRVIEFCFGIPLEQQLSDGWTRSILRRGMAGILPPSIQWRAHKANLAPGIHAALRNGDREIVQAVIDQPGELERFVDPAKLRGMWNQYRMGSGCTADENSAAMTLFWTTMASLWLGRLKAGATSSVRTPRTSSVRHAVEGPSIPPRKEVMQWRTRQPN